jgi:hypothetical protein
MRNQPNVPHEFETNAVDDYFSRGNEPGCISVSPPGLFQGHKLFRGICSIRLAPPINADVGDKIEVVITVTDPSRETNPFTNTVQMTIGAKELTPDKPQPPRPPRPPAVGTTAFPQINEVTREQWGTHKFDECSGLRFTGATDEDDELEVYVNMDNVYFLNELARVKDEAERPLIRHYYRIGLVLVCLGMLQQSRRTGCTAADSAVASDDICSIARLSGGVASVIVPIVRNLAATAAKATPR